MHLHTYILPVVGQLYCHLYESIWAHAMGFRQIFPKLIKNHNLHINILGQSTGMLRQ